MGMNEEESSRCSRRARELSGSLTGIHPSYFLGVLHDSTSVVRAD